MGIGSFCEHSWFYPSSWQFSNACHGNTPPEGYEITKVCGACNMIYSKKITTQSEQPEEVIHDPTTTIVERIEMTPELRKAFENAGYNTEDVK